MANNQLIAIIPFLFLWLAVHPSESVDLGIGDGLVDLSITADTAVHVAVEGLVYCQKCGEQGFNGAQTIASATVNVTCIDYKKEISYEKTFTTDKGGHFYAELKGYKMSHCLLDHPLHACKVRLVSSPLTDCDLRTNTNDGVDGALLRYQNKTLSGSSYEAVIYATGPFAFAPTQC